MAATVEHERGDTPLLVLDSIIGLSGAVPQGAVKHPKEPYVAYALGSNVVVRNLKTGVQEFLQGHTNAVSCLAFSKDGKHLASGQMTHMGFQADIILWDFAARQLQKRFVLHKVKVQAIAFSPSGRYLVSLGGEDDNSVIVWDLAAGVALCGAPASKDSAGTTHALAYLSQDDLSFVTGGDATLRVWQLDEAARKVRPTDCQLGNQRRVVKALAVDAADEFFYAGTTTGDVLQISVGSKLFKQAGPPKTRFSQGVTEVALVPGSSEIVVGCGDGTLAVLSPEQALRTMRSTQLQGRISSISTLDDAALLVATSQSNLYRVDLKTLAPVLESTGHAAAVTDIAFPSHTSELFATSAADSTVRIWNAATRQELLRIEVPNVECKCLTFKADGSSLLTGWSDGKIRAFGPQSGRVQFEITDAHPRGVTALAVTHSATAAGEVRLVSGGEDGQVRVWRVGRDAQVLEETMKEHKGAVSCIVIRNNDLECVSASDDGSCIIWDLTRYARNQVMFQPCLFKAVSYYPDESQLLTCGTDRKACYWEAFDGSLIRELEVSQSNAVNGLDISADGKSFAVAGTDRLVKLYRYEEGDVAFVGVGHSSEIVKVKFSPDNRSIYSVATDGSIFKWDYPVPVDSDEARRLYGLATRLSA